MMEPSIEDQLKKALPKWTYYEKERRSDVVKHKYVWTTETGVWRVYYTSGGLKPIFKIIDNDGQEWKFYELYKLIGMLQFLEAINND